MAAGQAFWPPAWYSTSLNESACTYLAHRFCRLLGRFAHIRDWAEPRSFFLCSTVAVKQQRALEPAPARARLASTTVEHYPQRNFPCTVLTLEAPRPSLPDTGGPGHITDLDSQARVDTMASPNRTVPPAHDNHRRPSRFSVPQQHQHWGGGGGVGKSQHPNTAYLEKCRGKLPALSPSMDECHTSSPRLIVSTDYTSISRATAHSIFFGS